MTVSEIIRTAAQASKAWPYEEARKLLKRYQNGAPEKGHVLFETGYGPSGLPHIGTFNEVLRTTMVRNAYHALSDVPTRLIAFSDDMDGLRKVPDNVPNQAMLVMAHLLASRQIQVTVLNFASQAIVGRVKSRHLTPGAAMIDMVTDQSITEVDPEQTFAVSLEPHQGMSLLAIPAASSPPPRRHP